MECDHGYPPGGCPAGYCANAYQEREEGRFAAAQRQAIEDHDEAGRRLIEDVWQHPAGGLW